MILVGIDIGKNKHTFSIIDKNSGEILLSPSDFSNNLKGFLFLIPKLSSYTKSKLLIGMKIQVIITLPYLSIFSTDDIPLP